MKRQRRHPPTDQALEALRSAVAKLIEDHRRDGRPLAIWRDGKAVCVPAHRAEDGRYAMAALAPDAARGAGPAGIVEPAFKEWILLETVDLVVVPGVAFDPAGGRVGRGAGHYDRLLAGAGRACARVGLAFEFQVLAGVPTSGHDVGMDVIVTEQRTLRRTACAGQERNV